LITIDFDSNGPVPRPPANNGPYYPPVTNPEP